MPKRLRTLRKTRLLMMWFPVLCGILSFTVAQAESQGLEKKISISIEKKTLKEALDQIAATASVAIIYSNSKELINSRVSLHVKNEPLKQVLDKLLTPYPLAYKLIDDKIVIVYDGSKLNRAVPEKVKPSPHPVKGKVTDHNGSPLQGATVRIKDEKALTITDERGEFAFVDVPSNAVLQVSFIGYKTRELKITTDHDYLTIVLEEDKSSLNTVSIVSTGYQTLPKERATGSFAQPVKEMYDARVSTDVITRLNGITSGLLFNGNTTATQNGQLDINIRGRSTIFANDQPLIVIDNFPYSGDINNINPNDVQSITVLKDAAAASIWGVRAGNGVIVITTKKGKLNRSLQVSLNSNITVGQKPDLKYNPSYMGTSDYIDVEQYLFKNGRYDNDLNNTTTYPFISPVVEILNQERSGTLSTSDAQARINALRNKSLLNDVSKYLYQNSVKQQYALSLNGGDDKTSYYLSAGYDKNLQSQKDNDFSRMTLNSNLTFRPLKNLEAGTTLNYIQSVTNSDNTASNTLSGTIYPYAQLADNNGTPLNITHLYGVGFVQSAPSLGYQDWTYAPLKELGLAGITTKGNDIRISPNIKYSIIDGLSIEAKYQYEQYTTNYRNYQSQQTFYTRNVINQYSVIDNTGAVTGYNIPLGGILNESLTTVKAYNIRGQISYSKVWAKSAVNAIAGIEQNQTKTDGTVNSTLYGYDNNTGTYANVNYVDYYLLNPQLAFATIPNSANITGLLDRVRSYFANASYTYNNKYTLSASGRTDGSNYFGVATNLKSVPLWSVGGKWDISRESFYHLGWLPELKLRATYGYNGNLNRNITGITTFLYNSSVSTYTNLPQASISNIGNPELRWEKTAIANFGADFGLKNNVITGSLEFYIKNGVDIIGNESVAPSVGATTFTGNFAHIKGNGLDVQLASKNIDQQFKWFSTFLVSHTIDKVTRYTAPVIPSALTTADGASGNIYPVVDKPVYGIWSYRWAGLDPATGDPQGYLNGTVSKDYASLINPASANDMVYSGPARPTWFGGLNNRFTYKGFELSANISYKLGYYFRRSALNYSSLYNNWLGGNREFAARWQAPGDEKHTNVPSIVYPADQTRDGFYQYSQATVEKGDHIRLQDISLGYSFDKLRFKGLPFNSLQVYAYANNLGILWRANKLKLDPDYPTGTPSPKTISIGLKTNF
ncbi:SusC/RagA family TonB-linked outer membrane protein [Mucilaginibacter sp.]|uniref:SusC/RagA family TonB-linked outer membrane protein n=1 Tax=Mucilaginibacter sp. TaxID=1882438 RepID=UPI00356A463B